MRSVAWSVLTWVFAVAQAVAQVPGRSTGVGFAVGPIPLNASLTISHWLRPRLALRVDAQAGLVWAPAVDATAPCPPAGCSSVTQFSPDQQYGVAAGIELFELSTHQGFYVLGLIGLNRLTDYDPDRHQQAWGWQLGAGFMIPLGGSALTLEGRFVRFAIDSPDRSWPVASVGLRF